MITPVSNNEYISALSESVGVLSLKFPIRGFLQIVNPVKSDKVADLHHIYPQVEPKFVGTVPIADCIINGMVDKDYIKVITDKILVRLAEVCC